jgi:hypothetical protein
MGTVGADVGETVKGIIGISREKKWLIEHSGEEGKGHVITRRAGLLKVADKLPAFREYQIL